MAYRNYALFRKNSSPTKVTSLSQQRKLNPGGFKFFCLQGKLLTPFIKVIPTPSDAKITLTSDGYTQEKNTIYASIGGNVSIRVEKEGYRTFKTSFEAQEQDYVLKVSLVDLGDYAILTINPTPSDAKVTLTADGYTQDGNSIEVLKGTTITYVVEKEGYVTKTGTIELTKDVDLDIELIELVTITIEPTPSNAVVTLKYIE